MITINRKTRNQLTLNSTRFRFDVKKLTPVSEAMVYCTSNIQDYKNSLCLTSNNSQVYLFIYFFDFREFIFYS